MSDVVSPAVEAPWKTGLRGARANLIPGLCLQAGALSIVLAYSFSPDAREMLGHIERLRVDGGFWFSAISTPLFGGLIPFLYLRAHPRTRARYPWPHLLFFLAFWSVKGMEVDLLYRSLAAFVGTGNDIGTIARKVVVDQFLYNPLWAAPTGVLAWAWRENGFRWAPVQADLLRPGWYVRRIIPALLSTWGVWIPAVCLIYALPSSLQIPLFNVVLCFWTLLFAHVVAEQK